VSDAPIPPRESRVSAGAHSVRGNGAADVAASPSRALRQCPPFRASALTRDLWIDTVAWWGLPAIMMVVLLIFDWSPDDASPVMWLGAGLVIGSLLVMSNARGARVLRDLPRISALVEDAPDEAEDALAQALSRRPLPRGLRVLLYHRLAQLRHRQSQFDESAAIAQGLLTAGRKLIPAMRANLLLLFVESRLERGGLADAYMALHELYTMRLSLLEMLQRLWLQTRYEVAAGHDAHALAELRRRLEFAELMPATQCGLMHLLLSVAASRQGRDAEANWLRQRAELLCSDEQRQSLGIRGGVVA